MIALAIILTALYFIGSAVLDAILDGKAEQQSVEEMWRKYEETHRPRKRLTD
jgi:hypothetical protein